MPEHNDHNPEPLSIDTIRRVAKLARLAITDEQINQYRPQLGAVLQHMNRLQSLQLDNVEPLTHPLETTNRLDDDIPRSGLPHDAIMNIAPETAPPFIKVPKVLGGGSGSGGASGGGRGGWRGWGMTATPDLTLTHARNAIADRSLGAEEYVRAHLDRIQSHADSLNCFIEVFADQALAQAHELDTHLGRADSTPGPLAGIPIALKDNLALEGAHLTCASRILDGYKSPYTATAVQRLLDAGTIPIARANMDEFAMGSSGEHSAAGPTKNPWDSARVPGGSSSGSTVAVAARLVPGALGSDTGGSIRQPAAYCGIVGLKPTYSRVSRYGLVAFASSLDQIGPLTRTVEDAALLLSTIAGHDPLDSTSADISPIDFSQQLNEPITPLRIGVPYKAIEQGNHPAVEEAFNKAIDTFKSLGAEIIDVPLPHLQHAIDAYYILAPAEASSNLARFDTIRYGRRAELKPGEDLIDLYAKSRAQGFGQEVQRRIMLGTHALSSGYYDAYYLTALKVRRLIKQDFDNIFSPEADARHPACDALVMPTAPTPAFPLGDKLDDPLAMYLQDIYTVPANMAGLPAISVPMGFAQSDTATQLPLGLQIYTPHFQEHRLLRIAHMFEKATSFATQSPRP